MGKPVKRVSALEVGTTVAAGAVEEGMGEGEEGEAPADVPLPPMAGAGAGAATPRSAVGGPSAGTVPRGPGAASGAGPTAGAAGAGHGVKRAAPGLGRPLGVGVGAGRPSPPRTPVRPRAQCWARRRPQAAQSHLRRPPLLVSFLLNSVTFQRHCGHSHRFSRPLFFFSLAGDPLPHPLPHLFWCVEALNLYQADTHRQLVSAVWRLLVPFNLLIPQPAPFPVPYAPLQMPWSKPEVPPRPPTTHTRELRAQTQS